MTMDTTHNVSHLRQSTMHIAHQVAAIDHQRFPHGSPQRGMQHRTALGTVDFFSTEHGMRCLFHASLASKVYKQ
ncbi:hypothetical protein D3C81_2092670 [compost metagenome]